MHREKNTDHTCCKDSYKNIKVAFFLNFFFTIIEIIGGLYTNSLAILSDALHDLGDSFSLGLAWYFEKLSNKKRTKEFSYGFKRFSLLAALVNSVILILGSIFIIKEAIPRLFNPEFPNVRGMIILALVGVLINGLAVLRVRKGKTMNEKMVSWHLIEDVLGWMAVLVVSIIMLIWEIAILDPILSILITLFILRNVIKNFKQTISLFLQGVPGNVEISKIEESIMNKPKVKSVHDTHVWSLDGENNVLTTHVVIGKNATIEDAFEVKCKVKACLKKFNVNHATVEVEREGEKCKYIKC
jgi:cobalt-zinc-cadmium efflux system protein